MHPFVAEEVAVRVVNGSDTELNVEAIAEEALAYWEQHAPMYVSFQTADSLSRDLDLISSW